MQVVDGSGTGIAGLTVSFTGSNATLSASSAVTDSQGKAFVLVTLGSAGPATVSATAGGLAAVSLSITVQAASTVTITSVVNGASFQAPLASGSWITIGGSGFAASPTTASVVPLPLTLGGVGVKVNNIAIPLEFVNATQINAQLPYEIAPGSAAAHGNDQRRAARLRSLSTFKSPRQYFHL